MQGLCSMQSLHTIVYMYYKGQLFDIGNTVQVLTYPSPAFLKSIVCYVGTYKLADINQMQKGIPQSQRVFQFPFKASNEGAFGF